MRYVNLFFSGAILALIVAPLMGVSIEAQAYNLNNTPVGMTYYGGHYDERLHKWFVDNTYQCDRIKSGEFSAVMLDATPTEKCQDDPGVGYFDYIPLHNAMSYAELSINPDNPDYSALGNLPARTKLQVEYNGKCAILEKLDVGSGGYAVRGHQRSIDLWWQTARSLGFKNGFDVAYVSYVDQTTPLTPLGQTSPCIAKTTNTPEAAEDSQPESGEKTQTEPSSKPETEPKSGEEASEADGKDVKGSYIDSNPEPEKDPGDDSRLLNPVVFGVLGGAMLALIAGLVYGIKYLVRFIKDKSDARGKFDI